MPDRVSPGGRLGGNPARPRHLGLGRPARDRGHGFRLRGGWEEQVVSVGRGRSGPDPAVLHHHPTCSGLSRLRVRRRARQPVVSRPFPGRPVLYEIRELFKPGDRFGVATGRPDGDLVETCGGTPPATPSSGYSGRSTRGPGRCSSGAPEKAVDPTDRTLKAFLVAATGDEPAAGLARLALEHGLLGREVVFSADGALEPARITAEGVDQIVRSVRFRETGGADLGPIPRPCEGGRGRGVRFCSCPINRGLGSPG